MIILSFTRISNCWEYGLTDKWISYEFENFRKIIRNIDKKKKDLIIDFNPISLQNIFDTFYLLLSSFAVSVFVLLMELSIKYNDRGSYKFKQTRIIRKNTLQ